MACLIFREEFWVKESTFQISLYDLPDNIQTKFTNPTRLPTMIGNYFKLVKYDNIIEYANLVSSGLIYEKIRDVANEIIPVDEKIAHYGKPEFEREDAKKIMFFMLFSSNIGQHDDPTINRMKKIFASEMFPEVAELFKIIKTNFKKNVDDEKQHSRLSCLLQSIESKIILHRICKRIWGEGGQEIPIFTIHDSIVTTVGNEEFVENVMVEELTDCIGVRPSVKTEYWGNENKIP